ncbi:RHS repeat protein, partial [Marinobacter halodurans]
SIEARTKTSGDDGLTTYAVNWTGGVRYTFKGNATAGYAFTSWQQPPFDAVEATADTAGDPSGWRLQAKSGVVYTFDNQGQLTGIDALHGDAFSIENTLDSDGHLVSRQISSLKTPATLTYRYNATTQAIESAVLAHNGTTLTFSYAYNADGMLSQVTYPNDSVRSYHYEDTRYPQALTSIQDDGNTLATWEYDDQGRTNRNARGDGTEETTLQFNSDGTTTVTNALGKESIYSFTSVNGSRHVSSVAGQPSQNCAAANQAFTYTAEGRIETATDWDGHVTRYEYNDRGLVTLETRAEGTTDEQTIRTTWHSTFDVPVRIERGNQVQEFCYDDEGNQTQQATRDTSDPALSCAL